jgi:endogenous inhibitor of DNA gyrase (YacG/DUF329 family)
MTITEALVTVLAISTVVIALCAIPQALHNRRRRRTLSKLANSRCPSCGKVLGAGIISTTQTRVNLWHPAPGYTVAQLDLPSETLVVKCPQCAAEREYRLNGRLFERPT